MEGHDQPHQHRDPRRGGALAVGSRRFDEDRWELFDLSVDFSESTDRAADEPDRRQHMRDLWDDEARRNNVLPISDGLVDRFGGFIPPVWPAGPVRTFVPGGGPVADESVPMLWGGFAITADIDIDSAEGGGVVFALGDWFGGYALYLVEGRIHFTFARAADMLSLHHGGAPGVGRHDVTVSYVAGESGGLGRMVLSVDGAEVDRDAGGGDAATGGPARRGRVAPRLGQRISSVLALRASRPVRGDGPPRARGDAGCLATRSG